MSRGSEVPEGSATTLAERSPERVRSPRSLLTAQEAGEQVLNVPGSWLLAHTRAGTVPHRRLGRYVRFDADELREWARKGSSS